MHTSTNYPRTLKAICEALYDNQTPHAMVFESS